MTTQNLSQSEAVRADDETFRAWMNEKARMNMKRVPKAQKVAAKRGVRKLKSKLKKLRRRAVGAV